MVWPVRYLSEEEVQRGDRIRFAFEDAIVEHVVGPDPTNSCGWNLLDGGLVVLTESGQRYALQGDEADLDHIEFVMRAEQDPEHKWQAGWADMHMGGREDGSWRLL